MTDEPAPRVRCPPVVLTVDQRGSRRTPDAVPYLLDRLGAVVPSPLRPFERTAGDEVQGVLEDPAAVLAVVLALADEGGWSLGVGLGAVREPLPDSTRAGAGAAFEAARRAVDTAKVSRAGMALRGPEHPASPGPEEGPENSPEVDEDVRAGVADAVLDAETALLVLVGLRRRRTPAGREVVALAEQGLGGAATSERLGITPQAVSARLRAGAWSLEQRARPMAVRLLAAAAWGAVAARGRPVG